MHYYEKPEDVQIATSEISEKFRFFESFKEADQKKNEFRITPPPEGLVKQKSAFIFENQERRASVEKAEVNELQRSCTTAMIISKFRDLERIDSERNVLPERGPKPLKCFTPPREPVKYTNYEDDYDDISIMDSSSPEDDDDEDEDYDEDDQNGFDNDSDDTETRKYRARITAEHDEALEQVTCPFST